MSFISLLFPFDYIITTILFIIIIICTLKGFINSIFSLLTWIGSILITIYSYDAFSNFLSEIILRINFFEDYQFLSHILSIIIAIPIIFLISLFILKKIRNFLSNELDKQILGLVFDKIFGFIYGIIFSYIILSASIIIAGKFELNNFNQWTEKNSNILKKVENLNSTFVTITNNNDDKNN